MTIEEAKELVSETYLSCMQDGHGDIADNAELKSKLALLLKTRVDEAVGSARSMEARDRLSVIWCYLDDDHDLRRSYMDRITRAIAPEDESDNDCVRRICRELGCPIDGNDDEEDDYDI